MKKPVEAIDRMRVWAAECGEFWVGNLPEDARAILAYLDSIPDDAIPVVWPKELTREKLQAYAMKASAFDGMASALHTLAAIAPERKKRMVNIWNDGRDLQIKGADWSPFNQSWRKVAGPVEIDE